ncbi:MAG: DUF6778 family protein [Boseongicola sp.]
MRYVLFGGIAAFVLSGCSGSWTVDYEEGLSSEVTKDWQLHDVAVVVPEHLTVSNSNSFAPDADIVWHGERLGNRKAQVAKIIDEGLTEGASDLDGKQKVTISVTVASFHAVTPTAVARAPAAVHNIGYGMQVFDSVTGEPLTEPQLISADLEAFVGASAVTAALKGDTQRVRIVRHLAAVTRGWLGLGPDQRRQFGGVGR